MKNEKIIKAIEENNKIQILLNKIETIKKDYEAEIREIGIEYQMLFSDVNLSYGEIAQIRDEIISMISDFGDVEADLIENGII